MPEPSSASSDSPRPAVPIVARPAVGIGPRPFTTRLIALGIFAACGAVLTIAALLEPDPRGFGTHQQLRLFGQAGPCGMLIVTGLPCPTCGMTTSFAHFIRGHWARSIWAQPAGFVLALSTAALALVSVVTVVRGRWPRMPWWRIPPHHLFLGLLVLLLGGWAFKIAAGLSDGSLPYH